MALRVTLAVFVATAAIAFQPTFDTRPYHQAVDAGHHLAAAVILEKLYEHASAADKPSIAGILTQHMPNIGDVRKAWEWDDASDPKPDTKPIPEPEPLDKAEPLNALQAIVNEAKSRQIVILNEAHNSSQTRAFGMQLAQELRKLGYEYFAAETFAKNLPDTIQHGYPTTKTGWYSRDPVFGDFVRQAMKLGYKLVPYESTDARRDGDQVDQINRREIEQANNIVDRILKPHPDAKIFLYVGYSHATEDWRTLKDGREYAWMAARLKKLTGIDPLTIDQTSMHEHSAPAYENPHYRYATSKGWIAQPAVFRLPGGGYFVGGDYAGKIDMQVFHPRTKYIAGRPDWMRLGDYRRAFRVKKDWLPRDGRALISAFVAAETEDPIAMDRVVVTRDSKDVALLLPKGAYRVSIEAEDGSTRQLGSIVQK